MRVELELGLRLDDAELGRGAHLELRWRCRVR